MPDLFWVLLGHLVMSSQKKSNCGGIFNGAALSPLQLGLRRDPSISFCSIIQLKNTFSGGAAFIALSRSAAPLAGKCSLSASAGKLLISSAKRSVEFSQCADLSPLFIAQLRRSLGRRSAATARQREMC